MSPENVTPAMKPRTAKTRGNGTSGLKPSTQRGTKPAANHAAAQVKPIPIAPRMRRSHFPMITSEPEAGQHGGFRVHSNAKSFVLQSTSQEGDIQERSSSV